MLVVRIMGGLGNQMYQYAFSRGLAYKLGQEVQYDLSFYDQQVQNGLCCLREYELERSFGIKLTICDPHIMEVLKKRSPFNWVIGRYSRIAAINPLRCDRQKGFQNNVWKPLWPQGTDAYYVGYWQDVAYFDFVMEEVLRDFEFRGPQSAYVKDMESRIRSGEAIALHFRRTDFVRTGQHMPISSYYTELIRVIESNNLRSVRCFIFSDDMVWVKAHFQSEIPLTYVDRTTNPSEDLYLMSLCPYRVGSSASSFFRWAELLGVKNV